MDNQVIKFRWMINADKDRRVQIAKKIKSKLKLATLPELPAKLIRGYGTDFEFNVGGQEYRFYYAGHDTPKGGIFVIELI